MDIKIIKQIGQGLVGTVYLINYGSTSNTKGQPQKKDTKAIYKIEKIIDLDNYNRQIDFDETVAKKYPGAFLNLEQYGIINNCTHIQEIPNDITDKKLKNKLIKKNESTRCCFLIYTPVLDGTLENIKTSLTKKQRNDMVYQIVYKINIMQKLGYMHRDIHSKNIMYKKLGNTITWYIIDYGLIYNKKYNLTSEDKDVNADFISDIISFVFTLVDNKLLNYIYDNNLKILPTKQFMKKIAASPKYDEILKMVPLSVQKDKTKQGKRYFNVFVTIIAIVNHYELYMKVLGFDPIKYKKYMTTQTFDTDLILFMLKNHGLPQKILNYIDNKK